MKYFIFILFFLFFACSENTINEKIKQAEVVKNNCSIERQDCRFKSTCFAVYNEPYNTVSYDCYYWDECPDEILIKYNLYEVEQIDEYICVAK